MENKITMKDRVYQYMVENGSITTLQAFVELGCTRLSHYMFVLRQEYPIDDEWIKTTNRYGDKVEYKRYFFKK